MSSWERTHRRYRLVYAVADAIALRGPEVIDEWQAAIHAEFGGMDGFLKDVQRRWYTAVDAYLDTVLEDEPADMDAAVAEIMWSVATTDRGLRLVLDGFADHPALAEGDAYHRRSLLALTGVDQDALVPVQGADRQPACRRALGAARRALSGSLRATEPA
ncbi:MAG: hypothetical protein ACRDQ7_14565 [Haloechinothrix sp.]